MKRILTALTILVLCMSAIGADFVLTLSDYRAQIKRRLNVDITNTTWMSDTVMNQFIREAIVTIVPTLEGNTTTKTVITSYGQMSYKIDTNMVSIAEVGWKSGDTVRWLAFVPRDKWSVLTHQSTNGGDDPYLQRPSVYDVSDDSIFVFPIPTFSDDTLMYIGPIKITNIATASSFSGIPQHRREKILNYATYLVATAKQRGDAVNYKVTPE